MSRSRAVEVEALGELENVIARRRRHHRQRAQLQVQLEHHAVDLGMVHLPVAYASTTRPWHVHETPAPVHLPVAYEDASRTCRGRVPRKERGPHLPSPEMSASRKARSAIERRDASSARA